MKCGVINLIKLTDLILILVGVGLYNSISMVWGLPAYIMCCYGCGVVQIQLWPISSLFQCSTHCRLNLREGDVQPSERERVKRVVYAIVYGVGEEKKHF